MALPELTPQLALLEEAMIVLPNRRHLLPAQPQTAPLRNLQRALELRGHDPRPLPTTARHRELALFPARSRPGFLASVSWACKPSPLLVSPEGTQQAKRAANCYNPSPDASVGYYAKVA
jgi:hypothetical protein